MKISTIKSSLATLVSLLIMILIWKAMSVSSNSEIILPSPESVFREVIRIVQSSDFLPTVFATIMRAVFAFIFACIMGIIVGMITGFSKLADLIAKPVLLVVMSTPIISFILLALIWFKSNNVPIFATFLMTFPIITVNVSEGIKNIDNGLIEMAKVYKVCRWRILAEIYFPSIASYLTAAISTAVGLGWKVVVTAEVLSQPQLAIGTSLQNAKIYLETSRVLAWTLIAVILSFIFEVFIRIIEKRIIKWR
jgi:ABC-type nitrate/sulfonate/bicarbonate transport system, permease component